MKSNNAVVFLFDFHIALQRPLQAFWSRWLPYVHEPSAASFAPCFKSLPIHCLRRQKSLYRCSFSQASFRLVLSSCPVQLVDPSVSNNTYSRSVSITEIQKSLQHNKLEIQLEGLYWLTIKCVPLLMYFFLNCVFWVLLTRAIRQYD